MLLEQYDDAKIDYFNTLTAFNSYEICNGSTEFMKEMVGKYNFIDGDILKKLNHYMETVQDQSNIREKEEKGNWYSQYLQLFQTETKVHEYMVRSNFIVQMLKMALQSGDKDSFLRKVDRKKQAKSAFSD